MRRRKALLHFSREISPDICQNHSELTSRYLPAEPVQMFVVTTPETPPTPAWARFFVGDSFLHRQKF
jgi:hypothetical protein